MGILNSHKCFAKISIEVYDSIFIVQADKVIKVIEESNTSTPWIYSNITALIGVLVTFVGFLLGIVQLRKNAKANEGELALKLDERIGEYRSLYKHLFENGIYYETIPIDKYEDIESYLTFYDTSSFLVKNKQIRITQIDNLYGYRFLTLMHNKSVQEIIKTKPYSWTGLLWLYKEILSLRRKKGEEIPRSENIFNI